MIFKMLPETCHRCGHYTIAPNGNFTCTDVSNNHAGDICDATAEYLRRSSVAVMRDTPANVPSGRQTKEIAPAGKSVYAQVKIPRLKTILNRIQRKTNTVICLLHG